MAIDDPSAAEFLGKLHKLRLGGAASNPRPHKPLLLLIVLSRAQQGRATRLTFREAARSLTPLLRDYAGSAVPHPGQPFWRLQRDGVWEIIGAEQLRQTKSGDALVSDLTDDHPGDLPNAYLSIIKKDADVLRVAINIVANYLPPDVRQDVLRRLALEI